jgi:hypothetical protein
MAMPVDVLAEICRKSWRRERSGGSLVQAVLVRDARTLDRKYSATIGSATIGHDPLMHPFIESTVSRP